VAQWPLVVNRLLALLPTLPGWAGVVSVHDGAAYDSVKQIFATVAHSDDGQTTQAGGYTSTLHLDGVSYAETGHVACQITYNDDRATITTARGALFPLLNQLDAAIRADRTLGVLSKEGTTDLDVSILSAQTIPGAAYTVPFTLHYFTVT
jgi:hypothetical protein